MSPAPEIRYPTVEEVYEVHETIIESDPDAAPGVQTAGAVDYALEHVRGGPFDVGPETLHEKAATLMRLLASNHEFADGNKRTALGTTAAFYLTNGYYFDYPDEEIRTILKILSVVERAIDVDALAVRFEEYAQPVDRVEDRAIRERFDRIVDDGSE